MCGNYTVVRRTIALGEKDGAEKLWRGFSYVCFIKKRRRESDITRVK